MLKERNKRLLIVELDPETVLNLLMQLPKRLLEGIVKHYELQPTGKSKYDLAMAITEYRKTIFRSLKYSFSYVDRTNSTNQVPEKREDDPSGSD
jgi:hypothetical protein